MEVDEKRTSSFLLLSADVELERIWTSGRHLDLTLESKFSSESLLRFLFAQEAFD